MKELTDKEWLQELANMLKQKEEDVLLDKPEGTKSLRVSATLAEVWSDRLSDIADNM